MLGYVLTKAKGSASIVMEIGQGDPLLATWQRGLGRATAWTSDATARWLSQWIEWEGYVDFWGAVVRDVLPAGRENPPATFVSEGLASGQSRSPGGRTRCHRHCPGANPERRGCRRSDEPHRCRQLRRLGAPGRGGAYWVAVTVANPDGSQITSSSGAVSAYEEEFAFREPDPTLGSDIVELTGGRLNPEPPAVFDAAPVRGRAEVSIWPWLVVAALSLFLIDVALRRLVLSVGDADAWKEGLTTSRTKEKRRIEKKIEEAAARRVRHHRSCRIRRRWSA